MVQKKRVLFILTCWCLYSFTWGQEARLIWSDEFDGEAGSVPNETFWNFELGDGWGNEEQEYYTTDPNNVSLDGQGHLQIVALKTEPMQPLECYYGKCLYTSARITTQNKFEFTYGRVEARLKVPNAQGLWPAFWMLGTVDGVVNWPTTGEIDILELIGSEPMTAYGHGHGPGYFGAEGLGAGYTLKDNPAETFHVYALEWQQDELRWYVDDNLYYTLTPDKLPEGVPWVFDNSFFLLLNVAVGGLWPGYPDDTTTFPQTLVADYIRVYELPADE
jgi:beta-glucanase (GH16 family)